MAHKVLTRGKALMIQENITGTRLHELTGIDAPTISKLMNGLARPYPSQKERIAKALSWEGDPDDLFLEAVVVDE